MIVDNSTINASYEQCMLQNKEPNKITENYCNNVLKIIMLFWPAGGAFEACRVIGADGPGLTTKL